MDPSSVADVRKHRILNAFFNIKVDIKSKCISGSVRYDVECYENDKSIFLDVSNINIKEVQVDFEHTEWIFSEHKSGKLGQCLEIPIKNKSSRIKLLIKYSTTEKCTALQWIPAEATSDKKKPFFFSQCQAIHARSLYPCQDTPGVKFSYEAEVHAPNDINVLLAAVRFKEPSVCSNHDNCKVYHYKQSVPVPSYLFAIAGGEIVGKKIGPRSTVWAEPSLVNAAAEEFEACEAMLSAAEELCGKYEWGVYDILIPPPTFPYGGMENPCLTYLTQTLLAGDKSLVNVVAHEIAHSWTGNLVTNNTWEHFWLNEGHTNYLERLIMSKLHGPDFRELSICIGYEELRESVKSFGFDHEFTKLIPKLDGVDPDDSYSRVPYEKGSLLLYHLESIYGQDKMLQWLKAYLKEYARKSLSTNEWLQFLRDYLSYDIDEKIDWNAWLSSPGMPPIEPPKNKLILDCEKAFAICRDEKNFILNSEAQNQFKMLFGNFLSKQKEYFFRLGWYLEDPLSLEVLDKIEEFFGPSTSKNSRIRLGWSIICIKSRHKGFTNSVFEFLNSMGVMKFVRPIYKALRDWPEMREIAIKNFEEQKPSMYPSTARLIAIDLDLSSGKKSRRPKTDLEESFDSVITRDLSNVYDKKSPKSRQSGVTQNLVSSNHERILEKILQFKLDFDEITSKGSKTIIKLSLDLIAIIKGTFNPFGEEDENKVLFNLEAFEAVKSIETGRQIEDSFEALLKNLFKLESLINNLDTEITRLAASSDLLQQEALRADVKRPIHLILWRAVIGECRSLHKRLLDDLKQKKELLIQLPFLTTDEDLIPVRYVVQYWKSSFLIVDWSRVVPMLNHCLEICQK